MIAPEFAYSMRAPAQGSGVGAHLGIRSGEGDRFRSTAPFPEHPDPRRLDVRASLRDPARGLWVRTYEPRVSIDIVVLLDLTGSMAYSGSFSKVGAMAEFLASLARSGPRQGDRVGIVAATNRVLHDLCIAPTRATGALLDIVGRLRRTRPEGSGGRQFHSIALSLPPRRRLVFLLSDFHWPSDQIDAVLAALAVHDVVPVALWDERETLEGLSGFARVADLEDGTERLYWLRPALEERVRQQIEERRSSIHRLCAKHGRRLLVLPTGFDADAVSAYFLGR